MATAVLTDTALGNIVKISSIFAAGWQVQCKRSLEMACAVLPAPADMPRCAAHTSAIVGAALDASTGLPCNSEPATRDPSSEQLELKMEAVGC